MTELTDPRTTEEQQASVGEEIVALLLLRSVLLTRFRSRLTRDQLALLETANEVALSRTRARLERIATRGSRVFTQKQWDELERMLTSVYREYILGTGAPASRPGMYRDALHDLTGLAFDEAEHVVGVLRDVGLDARSPSRRRLRRILTLIPFVGALLREWYDQMARDASRRVLGALRDGIMRGLTVDQIMQTLRGTARERFRDGALQTTRNQAAAIATSGVTHTSQQARVAVAETNPMLVEGVIWLATLDTKTCVRCAALDDEVYPVDAGPRPPLHPNCRCDIGFVVAGEGPPRPMTFAEFLARLGRDDQEEVLGVERARLFRAGQLGTESDPLRRDVLLRQNLTPRRLDDLRRRR